MVFFKQGYTSWNGEAEICHLHSIHFNHTHTHAHFLWKEGSGGSNAYTKKKGGGANRASNPCIVKRHSPAKWNRRRRRSLFNLALLSSLRPSRAEDGNSVRYAWLPCRPIQSGNQSEGGGSTTFWCESCWPARSFHRHNKRHARPWGDHREPENILLYNYEI